jgi:hypothetical protein
MDSLANTFAVNGSAGWGTPADASNSVRQAWPESFDTSVNALMRDPYAAKTIVSSAHASRGMAWRTALAHALYR